MYHVMRTTHSISKIKVKITLKKLGIEPTNVHNIVKIPLKSGGSHFHISALNNLRLDF